MRTLLGLFVAAMIVTFLPTSTWAQVKSCSVKHTGMDLGIGMNSSHLQVAGTAGVSTDLVALASKRVFPIGLGVGVGINGPLTRTDEIPEVENKARPILYFPFSFYLDEGDYCYGTRYALFVASGFSLQGEENYARRKLVVGGIKILF